MTLRDVELSSITPSRLWRGLGLEERTEAALAFFSHAWAEPRTRREGILAISRALRFREEAVRRLPADKRAAYLARLPQIDDSLVGSMLLALHLERRGDLLAAFLDALGIPHQTGVIDDDHALAAPEPEALRRAVAALDERFPRDHVDLYLACRVDPGVQPDLASFDALLDAVHHVFFHQCEQQPGRQRHGVQCRRHIDGKCQHRIQQGRGEREYMDGRGEMKKTGEVAVTDGTTIRCTLPS